MNLNKTQILAEIFFMLCESKNNCYVVTRQLNNHRISCDDGTFYIDGKQCNEKQVLYLLSPADDRRQKERA